MAGSSNGGHVPASVPDNDPGWLAATAPDPSTVHRFSIGGHVPLVTDDPVRQDPGHLLPADVWQQVQRAAAARQRELEDRDRERRFTAGPVAAVDRTIPAYAHGGVMPGGPRLGVIHSAETPLRAGYAYSIAANWFGTPRAGTSATVMIDPAETVRMLPDNVVAYHVGPAGNGFTVGVEQSGYASGGRAQWLADPLGLAQMRRVASYMRDVRDRWGLPIRRATDAQIIAAARGELQRAGWCEHDDIRRVLGGTTHTDPGDYPWDELLAAAAGAGEQEEEQDMTPEQARQLADVAKAVGRIDTVETAVRRLAELLSTDRQRSGVLPSDSVQKASPIEQLGYIDASALQTRRMVENLRDDMAELQEAVEALRGTGPA